MSKIAQKNLKKYKKIRGARYCSLRRVIYYNDVEEVKAMSNYTTGEVAKACGISVRTVQYYDTRGVLCPSELTDGGRRLYSEGDVEKMKIICFLRKLGIGLDTISKIMREGNSNEVISLILDEQRSLISSELEEKQSQLQKLDELKSFLSTSSSFSVKSIADAANIMENKKKLKKLYRTLLFTAIPVGILEWSSIILWIATGIWWPFVVYTVIAIPYAILISRYYLKSVAYICPNCHEIFVPKFKESFFAYHTPRTRRLVCPKCNVKSYCVETHRDAVKEDTAE